MNQCVMLVTSKPYQTDIDELYSKIFLSFHQLIKYEMILALFKIKN